SPLLPKTASFCASKPPISNSTWIKRGNFSRSLSRKVFMKWKHSALVVSLFLLAGCTESGIWHGMEKQPKVKPLAPSEFWSDGRRARPDVPGTVARGHLEDDTLLYTGKVNGQDATIFPFPVTKAVLER